MTPLADARRVLGPVTVTGSSATAEAMFAADAPVFAGHFPGHPLVPGVATIGLLVATYQAAVNPAARLIAVARCKWKSPGLPGDVLAMRITWQPHADGVQLKGTVSCGSSTVCEAVLLLS